MTIEAKIICDSVGPNGVRLTTFVLKYPRFIHSEFMTHRAFSRNASSSRAIPFEKQVQMLLDEPALPLEFRRNQKGMQAGEPLTPIGQLAAEGLWLEARDKAIFQATELNKLGVHKQYVNRLIEPFSHISVVCTATEFSNFFALRHHSMAQPEIAELAKQMWETYSNNVPYLLSPGEWHLPFVTKEELKNASHDLQTYGGYSHVVAWDVLIKRSVARCARVSYLNHDGTTSTYEQDCALYDRLLAAQPIHASPAEHQAQVRSNDLLGRRDATNYSASIYSGNLRGWIQYRKTLPGENITSFEGSLG